LKESALIIAHLRDLFGWKRDRNAKNNHYVRVDSSIWKKIMCVGTALITVMYAQTLTPALNANFHMLLKKVLALIVVQDKS